MYLIHCDNLHYNLINQALECVEALSLGRPDAWTQIIARQQCVNSKEVQVQKAHWRNSGATNIVALWKTALLGQPVEGEPIFTKRHKRLMAIKQKFTKSTIFSNLEALDIRKVRRFAKKHQILKDRDDFTLLKTSSGWNINNIPIPGSEFNKWFIHQQPWELILDDIELRTLNECLDTYSRFLMGQYGILKDIANSYSVNPNIPDWDTSEAIASDISQRVLGTTRCSFGIYHPKLAPEAQQAYGLYQLLRYCESHHRNPSGGLQTCYDTPRQIPSNVYVANTNVTLDTVPLHTTINPILSKEKIEKWVLHSTNPPSNASAALLQIALLRSNLEPLATPEPFF